MTEERASQLAASLARWAASRFGGEVAVAGAPTSPDAGMDSEIVFVDLAGDVLPPDWRTTLVLRVPPDVDRLDVATAEVDVQRWCATVGYPAPTVLALAAPGEIAEPPAQVMQRAPGVPMLEAMVPAVWRAPGLARRLADLHVQLHGLPGDGWPLAEQSLARRRLRPVHGWVEALDDPELAAALERAEALIPELEDAPGVPCHGDFHPLNVLVDGEASTVIDWTDAGLGDRHGDVARTHLLFLVASVAASSRVERVALRAAGPLLARAYLRRYEAQHPLDHDRLARWEALHLLHAWAQVRALHAGIIGRDEERGTVPETLAPWLAGRLQERLDRSR